MEKQHIIFEDLGIINYKNAWDYQEELLKKNLDIKSEARKVESNQQLAISNQQSVISNQQSVISNQQSAISNQQSAISHQESAISNQQLTTEHHLLFCEHPSVYTLGKSGHIENVLLSKQEMEEKEVEFFRTNRGGDITFHGLQQIVGYPILDLEKFSTDLNKYLHDLEEVIILTIAEYGIEGGRSKGETGVWLDSEKSGSERKICAMGIRCSRWITMHGFALNVNTDLSYFNNIIPCGITNKKVTSIEKELGHKVDFKEAKGKVKKNFEKIFDVAFN